MQHACILSRCNSFRLAIKWILTKQCSDILQYICSAQSKNRYNSGIVLRKVGILTLSANSGIVPDNSRIAQGIYVENR